MNDYPVEYWKSPANEEGYEFYCPFCLNFFKTKSGLKSHMKPCCLENNFEEYSDNILLEDDSSVGDFFKRFEAKTKTIKHYLSTNELQHYANKTPSEIKEKIRQQLLSNGFHSCEADVFVLTYQIYRFLFEVTEGEESDYRKKISEEMHKRIFGNTEDSE